MEKSAVIQLLEVPWVATNTATTRQHSWRELNGALYEAVAFAIKHGFQFERDDFQNLYSNFRGGYWMGMGTTMLGESLYSLAVDENNLSACLSFEAWQRLRPYFQAGQRLVTRSVVAGLETEPNCRWSVTSLHPEHLNVGQYRRHEDSRFYEYERVPFRRAQLTRKDLRGIDKKLKEASNV